jgi:N-acetylglucosaminyl-diphospho-decaprenol L-rhamnosyltransferase
MHSMSHDTALPDVSIVIVNWNSRDYLEKCLKSLSTGRMGIAAEVIVIDNASFDGSEALIREGHAGVTYIQGRDNLGFARANNLAVERATGRNLLFLNPDTEVLGDAIEHMVRFLDTTPDAGAVGCRLLNTDGSLQTSCVLAFPTILNQVLDSEFLRHLYPRSRLWGVEAFGDPNRAPARVEALSGACILVRRTSFLEVGRFTEAYFMYKEDVDLCFKLHRAGLHNYHLGNATVVHHGGQSSAAASESQFGNVLMRESTSRYMRLHRGAAYATTYRLAIALSALARIAALVLARVVGLGRFRPSAVETGLRKWYSVLRWSVGAEAWVRNPGAR